MNNLDYKKIENVQNQNTNNNCYSKARNKLSAGRYTTAIRILLSLIENSSYNSKSLLMYKCRLGECYIKIIEYEKANVLFNEVLSQDQDYFFALKGKADLAIAMYDYDRAIQYYLKTIEYRVTIYINDSEKGLSYLGLARAYYLKGDFSNSNYYHAKYYLLSDNKSKPLFPDKKDMLIRGIEEIDHLILYHNYHSAIKVGEKYYKDNFSDNLIHQRLGYCYLVLNDIESAKKNFNICLENGYKEIKIFDKNHKLSSNLDSVEKIKIHERYLHIFPNSFQVLYKLAHFCLDIDLIKTEYYINKALTISPNDKYLNLLLVRYYFKTEKILFAKELLTDIIEKEPQFVPALFLLGRVFQEQNNIQLAHQYFDTVISLSKSPLNTHFENAHIEKGKLYFKEGFIKMSENCFLKVIHHNPQNNIAHLELAKIYISKSQYEKAINQLNKASKTDKHRVFIFLELARLYLKLENYFLSEYYYKESLTLRPDDFITMFEIGYCYYIQNKFDLALQFFEKVLIEKPTDKRALYFYEKLSKKNSVQMLKGIDN